MAALQAAEDFSIATVITAADKNQDGRLSLEEYLPLDVQARHHGADHFHAGDADKNGLLDATELAAVLQKQTWFAILSEGIGKCFSRLDADHDGRLNAGEYRQVSRMGGHAAQHFKCADKDQDGFLSLAEFTAHAEQRLKTVVTKAPRKKKS
ncbi:EF-hand domain-containing protein [Prosthecobacter sp. SYSU 5D2]|uniref:EF-hand domain-containing protein n=1 Tax=Prosthecobacter sp. SYSU 5D2 TaxID=3134134 RepID=UPI0031FEFABD